MVTTNNPVWDRHCELLEDLEKEVAKWVDLADKAREDRLFDACGNHIPLSRPEARGER